MTFRSLSKTLNKKTPVAPVALCALALAGAGVAQAADTTSSDAGPGARSGSARAELSAITAPAKRFERSLDAGQAVTSYRRALRAARAAGVGSSRHLLERRRATPRQLRIATRELKRRVARVSGAGSGAGSSGGESGAVAGVSQATLDTIAACESGGDPAAVNAAGYYGKYQFDTGTWASVGGSGNPAAAPEAEQDYRASLLYQRAGSSPWPVCGR